MIKSETNWFKKLNAEEQHFVRQRCSRNVSQRAEERVIGGYVAEKGQSVAQPETLCSDLVSSTLRAISLLKPKKAGHRQTQQWHAITAYHCFTSEKSRSRKLRLKFGGLCHSQGSMNDDQEFAQECLNGTDMYTADCYMNCYRHSSDDDENATFKVHVIGWHDGKYPLAILQINERISTTYVVCLQYSIGFKNREPEGFVPKVVFDDETHISIQMSQEELANSSLHYATKKQCNVEGKGMFFCAKPYNRPTG
ncbi:hypothetical protein DdX_19219 [Ditylenchus destructor]|uniref:Uncharacterized protein n=1 Tax=Ditylenchus destructor TaxID=166010 RepID=A0AAD4QXK9_9BILA|nr:hypothetical protein DdX_19219 [Ditylenchus destructor]